MSSRLIPIWACFCSLLWPNSTPKHTLVQASHPRLWPQGPPATYPILISGVGSGSLETEASLSLCPESRKVGTPRLSMWAEEDWSEREVDFSRRVISSLWVAPIACTFGLTRRNKIGLLWYPSKVTELCLKRIIYSYYNWIDRCRLNW